MLRKGAEWIFGYFDRREEEIIIYRGVILIDAQALGGTIGMGGRGGGVVEEEVRLGRLSLCVTTCM